MSGWQTFTINVVKAHPWHNAAMALDVTGDGHIVASDALAVINFVNSFGSLSVPAGAGPNPPYYDVNADGVVAPDDALAVIDYVNAVGSGVGNQALTGIALNHALNADLIALLASDVAAQRKRRNL